MFKWNFHAVLPIILLINFEKVKLLMNILIRPNVSQYFLLWTENKQNSETVLSQKESKVNDLGALKFTIRKYCKKTYKSWDKQ